MAGLPTSTTYTIKPGDTLGSIAAANNTDVASLAKNNNIADPNKIVAGSTLNLAQAPLLAPGESAFKPQQSIIPGIGTLTVTPKAIPTTPTPDANAVGENAAGLYERTGTTPPAPVTTAAPVATPTTYTPPAVAGLPAYPTTDSSTAQSGILTAAKTLQDSLDSIQKRIDAGAVPGPDELSLQDQLVQAKKKLADFDTGTLSAEEALNGQGRGTTTGTINNQQTVLDRTRALQRLGFATDADTTAQLLSNATANRTAQGAAAQNDYNIATKRLDIAMNVQDEMDKLNTNDQNTARQYLLDVVNFADGKSYTDLDPETQQAITHAVANSPITLDMVQTALQSGKDKAAAAAAGDLRSVAGVGVVQISPDGSYKVVVPENPSNSQSPSEDVPSFNEYLESQNIPYPALTQDKIAQLQDEYDATYGGATVSLGKLTATNKNDLAQAGLGSAAAPVQSYFLNAPSAFRDQYQQQLASGKAKANPTLNDLVTAYTTWYNATKTKSTGISDADLQSLFGQ